MNQQTNDGVDYKTLIEWAGVLAKYGPIAVGGGCLLFYGQEIGQFPEGIGFGEGLAFYLVSAWFVIGYFFYLVLCTSTGCLLVALPGPRLHAHLSRSASPGGGRNLHFSPKADFSILREPPLVAMGFVGLFVYVAYIAFSADHFKAALLLIAPVAQAVGVFLLLWAQRDLNYFRAGVLVSDEESDSTARKVRVNVVLRRFAVAWLLLMPFALTPLQGFFVDSAFTLAQLRKESATVHLKAPWSTRAALSTLTKGPSFLGSDYVEFKNVKVLLKSVGQKVVIELPGATGVTRLSVPSDAIYVE
jgi:hypothetical protein